MSTTPTYRLDLPYQRPPLTSNQSRSQYHWSVQREAKRDVQHTVWALAKHHKLPSLDRCVVVLTWHAQGRQRRDPDSLGPMVKAVLDGLVQAGVLEDDDSTRVSAVVLRVVTGAAVGRVELVVMDPAAADGLLDVA